MPAEAHLSLLRDRIVELRNQRDDARNTNKQHERTIAMLREELRKSQRREDELYEMATGGAA